MLIFKSNHCLHCLMASEDDRRTTQIDFTSHFHYLGSEGQYRQAFLNKNNLAPAFSIVVLFIQSVTSQLCLFGTHQNIIEMIHNFTLTTMIAKSKSS